MNVSAETCRKIKVMLLIAMLTLAKAQEVKQDILLRTAGRWFRKQAGSAATNGGVAGTSSNLHDRELDATWAAELKSQAQMKVKMMMADPTFKQQAKLVIAQLEVRKWLLELWMRQRPDVGMRHQRMGLGMQQQRMELGVPHRRLSDQALETMKEDTKKEDTKALRKSRRVLGLPGLVAIIYYSVSGGPFGIEDVVSSAGPFYALLGFLVMPLVWSVPEALVAAELGTTFPCNSGHVTWVTAAFGPFWGFLEGFLSWLSCVTDNAIYPVLFRAYLEKMCPLLRQSVVGEIFVASFVLVFTAMTYMGLNIAGYVNFALAIFTILPFGYMTLVGLPQLDWRNIMQRPQLRDVDFTEYLNVLFWNLNYWDTASTLAGEVRKPKKTFPRAFTATVVLVVLSYFFPLLVGVGIPGSNWQNWKTGQFATVALSLRYGGRLLQLWVICAAAVSNIGQFVGEQCSNSFQLQGMAESGFLPSLFGQRSRFGTPTFALALNTFIILCLSRQEFNRIIDMLNGVYCMAQILEFISFIELRRSHKTLRRPFSIPIRSAIGCVFMLLPALSFCVALIGLPFVTKDWLQAGFLCGSLVLGVLLHNLVELCRRRNWLQFTGLPPATVQDIVATLKPGLASWQAGHEGATLSAQQNTELFGGHRAYSFANLRFVGTSRALLARLGVYAIKLKQLIRGLMRLERSDEK